MEVGYASIEYLFPAEYLGEDWRKRFMRVRQFIALIGEGMQAGRAQDNFIHQG